MVGSNCVSLSTVILIPVTQYTVGKGRAVWCLEAFFFLPLYTLSVMRSHPPSSCPPGTPRLAGETMTDVYRTSGRQASVGMSVLCLMKGPGLCFGKRLLPTLQGRVVLTQHLVNQFFSNRGNWFKDGHVTCVRPVRCSLEILTSSVEQLKPSPLGLEAEWGKGKRDSEEQGITSLWSLDPAMPEVPRLFTYRSQ